MAWNCIKNNVYIKILFVWHLYNKYNNIWKLVAMILGDIFYITYIKITCFNNNLKENVVYLRWDWLLYKISNLSSFLEINYFHSNYY